MKLIPKWTKYWAVDQAIPLVYYHQTASTNDIAKKSLHIHSPIIVIAESQTAGRGQKGRTWLDSDLMISWKYQVNKPPQPQTTSLMGKAIVKALKNTWPGLSLKIKLPNDIYAGDKKVAGLLVEAVSENIHHHQMIIGVGLNVFAAPDNQFGYLQKYLLQPITQNQWIKFLNKWQQQIQRNIPFCLVK